MPVVEGLSLPHALHAFPDVLPIHVFPSLPVSQASKALTSACLPSVSLSPSAKQGGTLLAPDYVRRQESAYACSLPHSCDREREREKKDSRALLLRQRLQPTMHCTPVTSSSSNGGRSKRIKSEKLLPPFEGVSLWFPVSRWRSDCLVAGAQTQWEIRVQRVR